MKKLNIFSLILILNFTSCTSPKTFEKEIQIIKSSNKKLENSTINISKKNEGLIINIVPETPIFENPLHSSAITSLITCNLYKNNLHLATTFNLKMEVDSTRTIIYSKNDINTIIQSYKDSIVLKVLEYTTNNFSPTDPGILDGYIDRVLMDFPTLKNENKNSSFYSLLNDFFIENRMNKQKGYAQNIFVVLYSMDKELDLLNTDSRYSKIIENIWNITFNTSIEKAEKELLMDN